MKPIKDLKITHTTYEEARGNHPTPPETSRSSQPKFPSRQLASNISNNISNYFSKKLSGEENQGQGRSSPVNLSKPLPPIPKQKSVRFESNASQAPQNSYPQSQPQHRNQYSQPQYQTQDKMTDRYGNPTSPIHQPKFHQTVQHTLSKTTPSPSKSSPITKTNQQGFNLRKAIREGQLEVTIPPVPSSPSIYFQGGGKVYASSPLVAPPRIPFQESRSPRPSGESSRYRGEDVMSPPRIPFEDARARPSGESSRSRRNDGTSPLVPPPRLPFQDTPPRPSFESSRSRRNNPTSPPAQPTLPSSIYTPYPRPSIESSRSHSTTPSTPNPNLTRKKGHTRSTSKSGSISSRLVSYFESGTDVVDETRRGIQGRIKESVSTPLSGKKFFTSSARRGSGDSEGSGESFYCIGENQTQSQEESQQEKGKGKGKGKECNFCGMVEMIGREKGMCEACEERWEKLKVGDNVVGGNEEEVRPPPPLKDWKTLLRMKAREEEERKRREGDREGERVSMRGGERSRWIEGRWSDWFEGGDDREVEKEVERDTRFYGFWDEVLVDDGVEKRSIRK